ncbi:MAG: sensor histidine kinase [Acidimicrobiales bacterium]
MLDWLRRFSIRTRLSTLAAIAVGLSVALAAFLSYVVVDSQLYRQVDSSLTTDAQSVFHIGGRIFNPSIAAQVLGHQGQSDQLQVVQPVGPPVFTGGVPLPDTPADQAVAANPGASIVRTVKVGGVRYRMITLSQSSSGRTLRKLDGTPLAIEVAHPLNDVSRTLADLRLILLIVALAGIGLAVGLGYLVAWATIRPVERLTSAAEHVAATQDLEATIEEQGEDELTRLARAFNAMLAALRASRQQQAQLVSDAGHELRTPLTSLRTNIEVLMRVQDLPPQDRTELLADVQGQLEELTNLIGDIVDLSRHDEQSPEPTEVPFDALVARAVERARRRAPSLQFRVQMQPGAVRAQPALLERAVLNVLDNAAKWSPPGGAVDLWLRRSDRWLLDVRDHGPGIAAEDLPRVFDRFYRAPSARAMPGSGLGLAIVRQVIVDHGGMVTASCPPGGGTLIHIELPLVVEPAPDDHAGPQGGEAPVLGEELSDAGATRISSLSRVSQTALSPHSARRAYVDPVADPPAAGFSPS